MAIATSTSTSTPFAKLVNLGDTLVGAFAGSRTRQQFDFKKNTAKTKDDGKPMLEEVMHFVAMPGTTAVTGNIEQGDTEPIEIGSHVRFAVSGFRWGQTIDARKKLPAFAGFKAGQTVSSDVYTFELVGWSATTEKPEAAAKAGFTVEDGRIVMRTQEEKNAYILHRSNTNQSTIVAKDMKVSIRRIDQTAEKNWEQAADELYLTKPWETGEPAEGSTPDYAPSGPHPADDREPEEEPF